MVLENRPAPTPTGRTDEPDMGTGLIDTERYISPEFARLEWERMWTKVWLNAGPLSDIPEVGDHFVHAVGRESFIFMRTTPDEIKGFYNICPHRGSRLRPSTGLGHAEQLQCPFHLWTFDIEGRLTNVPDRQHFVNGIPEEKQCLTEVRVETWAGWVWFNMDPEAEPLHEFLGVIPSHLDPYELQNYHVVEDYVLEWECNWKFAVDQFAEIYHLPALHPQLLEYFDHLSTPLDVYDGGKHSRQLIRMGTPDPSWTDDLARRFGYESGDQLTQQQRQNLEQCGVDPDSFTGKARELPPFLARARREWGERIGMDFSLLVDEQLVDDFHYMIFPNITLNLTSGSFLFFRPRPHPSNPNKCFWDYQVYARVPEGAPPPRRPATVHGTARNHPELFEALEQDMAQAQIVQESYHSRGFSGILLNNEERRIRAMHHALDQYIHGPDR